MHSASTKKSMDELGRPTPEVYSAQSKNPLIVVLDDVRSMQNVGSVFRTCDAFAVQELLLCGFTPSPPHRDIHKTALGATETVKWQHFDSVLDAVSYCRQLGYHVWAVEQAHNSLSLERFDTSGTSPVALIFGNEVDGVNQLAINASDGVIEIPQWGAKHSLNISVSVGVVLWELARSIAR